MPYKNLANCIAKSPKFRGWHTETQTLWNFSLVRLRRLLSPLRPNSRASHAQTGPPGRRYARALRKFQRVCVSVCQPRNFYFFCCITFCAPIMLLALFSLLAALRYINYGHKNIGDGDSYLSAEPLKIAWLAHTWRKRTKNCRECIYVCWGGRFRTLIKQAAKLAFFQ